VNAAAQELLTSHLWRDEEVLWSGQPLDAKPVAAHAARRAFFNGLGAAIGSTFVGVYVIAKFTLSYGIGVFELALAAAVLGTVGFAGWTAVRAWGVGRRLAGRTVYAVTNRRVLVVQGDEELWIGRREIADVAIRGNDISVKRHLTDAERRQSRDSALDEKLADRIEIGTREVVLAATPEPRQVLDLLQTLPHPSAS
jgi:hypothetical protein